MLIAKPLNDAINEQIGHEFGAMLQYVAIAAWFDREGPQRLAQHTESWPPHC